MEEMAEMAETAHSENFPNLRPKQIASHFIPALQFDPSSILPEGTRAGLRALPSRKGHTRLRGGPPDRI